MIDKTKMDKEIDYQANKLLEEINCNVNDGINALFEYINDSYVNGIEDFNMAHEFHEDWINIFSSAFYARWNDRHKPLNRQIERAIEHIALKRAKEALK